MSLSFGQDKSSSALHSLLAGMLSGACCTVLLQPLDVVRTRLQMAAPHSSHVGIWNTVVRITLKERPLALWSGVTPSLYRVVPGVGVYFCCLQTLSRSRQSMMPAREESPVDRLVMAALSRALASTLTAPFTLVKTHYESGKFTYSSVLSGLRSVHGREGLPGLMKGLVPTLLRDVPFSAVYYMLFRECRAWLDRWCAGSDCVLVEYGVNSGAGTLACGVCAGLLASMLTQPADVIKTHVQLGGNGGFRSNSARELLKSVYKENGCRVLFAGFIPRTLRRTAAAAITWTLFERFNGDLR